MFNFIDIKSIGVISDTHNLLRSEAIENLRGLELIIHAGDIGDQNILAELEKIAPVIAVRGNVDSAEWCQSLPHTSTIAAGEIEIFVIHNLRELEMGELSKKTKVVISGHSHKPLIERKDGVLYLNPGSAGRRRFKLPISLAKLKIDGADVQAEIIELGVYVWCKKIQLKS